jgi:hypothetical protein
VDSGERQRTEPALVVDAGEVGAVGVPGVVVEGVERLVGDLLRRPPRGVGLVGEDADHGVAGLVAVQHGGMPPLPVEGDVVPDSDRDLRRPWEGRPPGAGAPTASPAGLPSGVSRPPGGVSGPGWFLGAPGSGLVPGGASSFSPGAVSLSL